MIPDQPARQVQSIQTSFAIIRTIQARGSVTLNELADQLDPAETTIYNYLRTLESLGYIVKENSKYRLGLRFLTHGAAARNTLQGKDYILHALSEITDKISETVWWIVEELGRGVFVAKSTPGTDREVYGQVGKRSFLHTHAPGKAILAQRSDAEIRRVIEYYGLPVHTSKTITDTDELLSEVEKIREQGYASSTGETAHGVNSVGVAFDGPNGLTHALGVFRYTHDLGDIDRSSDILPHLDAIAEDITNSIYNGGRSA